MRDANSSENILFRETDMQMTRFINVNKSDKDRWRYVHRRVTYARDAGECLSDESVEGLSNAQLYRELDQPRRLRVEFYLRDEPVSGAGGDEEATDLFQSDFTEDETELERMVKSRRTSGERDPGERLIRQMRQTRGSAASSASAVRPEPGPSAHAYMSVEVATDEEPELDDGKSEDRAWTDFHRFQCFFASRAPQTE